MKRILRIVGFPIVLIISVVEAAIAICLKHNARAEKRWVNPTMDRYSDWTDKL